jgi:hypothetical protein
VNDSSYLVSDNNDSDNNDSDNNEGLSEKIAANLNLNSETADNNSITIMGEIMMCNNNPAKLGTILMHYASKFNSLDLL